MPSLHNGRSHRMIGDREGSFHRQWRIRPGRRDVPSHFLHRLAFLLEKREKEREEGVLQRGI